MLYVEVTTELFVFLFAQDHLGAHIGRQFERLPGASEHRPGTENVLPEMDGTMALEVKKTNTKHQKTGPPGKMPGFETRTG